MKKQIRDQALHFLWSAIALAPIVFMNDKVIGGALSGFLLGAPRELVDQWPVGDWKDTILDLVFFAAGGGFIGYLTIVYI